MSVEQTLGNYFKPEIRSRGREYFAKEQAFISNGSDTQIQGFVKSMPPLKVSFASTDIADSSFKASCTCSSASKGVLCKHIWALLLLTEVKYPDFLDSKTDIEIGSTQTVKPAATTDYKAKQAAYQKEQYQKQKQWMKDKKEEKKKKLSEPVRVKHAEDVEAALKFFSLNGFSLEENQDEELLKKAKKNLARIFHPDKGGSHDEAVVLNKHYETLARFLASLRQ